MTHPVRLWGPAVLWAALLFALSSRSALPLPQPSGIDKVEHFAAYAVLGALLARASSGSGVWLGWAILAGLLFGASDEWHQAFVPGRDSSALDWVADAFGTLAGALFHHRWHARRLATAS